MNSWAIFSFIACTALVAFISWKITKEGDLTTSKGYFLGGRGLTGIQIGTSILLTNWSAEQLIGLNGQGFAVGLSSMGWAVTSGVGLIIMATIFLPYFLSRGITTLPELVEERFGSGARNFMAFCILLGLVLMLLPAVLYTGALALTKLFNITELFDVSYNVALTGAIVFIVIIGSTYAIFGGLKAVVISDTINGIGFFFGSILVLVLGLNALGDGHILSGVHKLITVHPQMFNAVTPEKATIPFSTLFTGMILINIYFACANQLIIQRALGAKNLAEGQKGVLMAAVIKILSVGILLVPGIIAFHLYGDQGIHPDQAYPLLIHNVMPDYMVGIFGAVLFGAVISTFNSIINTCSTIFALNVYKPLKGNYVEDIQCITAGKKFGFAIAVFAACAAPFIQYLDHSGVYIFVQKFNVALHLPVLFIVLIGMVSKRATAKATITGAAFYVICSLYFTYFTEWKLNFLHQAAIMFTLSLIITWLMTLKNPDLSNKKLLVKLDTVDITHWKHIRLGCVVVSVMMVAAYALASSIGVVTDPDKITRNVLIILASSILAIFILNIIVKVFMDKIKEQKSVKNYTEKQINT
ncbi:solute:sodium symporter family transporter [Marinomonas flavescens]|uniref:solute:sodium symporter family transporter n=1 Tax=Marinomonas flavescens TaxID=2529379 RepID=UPI0010550DA4|nr:solute:sodium symporter family transporter [Marinomonas flavescens]